MNWQQLDQHTYIIAKGDKIVALVRYKQHYYEAYQNSRLKGFFLSVQAAKAAVTPKQVKTISNTPWDD